MSELSALNHYLLLELYLEQLYCGPRAAIKSTLLLTNSKPERQTRPEILAVFTH